MMTLCEEFRSLSFNTWKEIGTAKSVNYLLKEESITDRIVLNLKINQGGRMITQEFNRTQEGKNGADWEFWLLDKKNKFLCLRIQAKILNHRNDCYDDLHYQQKNGTFQSDLLIQVARRHNAIPLYCLYSYWDTTKISLTNWSCGSFAQAPESYGCALVHAEDIVKVRSFKDLNRIIPLMKPWHCLICCSGFGGGTLVESTLSTLQGLFGQVAEQNYIIENPPEYISKMLDGINLEEAPDENVSRIVILKE
jgi:hypothetical protein